MSVSWRIEFKDTVSNSNLQELSENVINTISTLKAQGFQKQYSKKNWKLGSIGGKSALDSIGL
jgi:UDP-galactopyranose mutase